jgi:hypothetical protein
MNNLVFGHQWNLQDNSSSKYLTTLRDVYVNILTVTYNFYVIK